MNTETYTPATINQLDNWLQENHATHSGLWIAHKKKHALTGADPAYPDIVLQLLRYGWIDGRRHPIDDTWTSMWCTPRRKGSNWSTLNLERYADLDQQGLITPAGKTAREAWHQE